MLAPNLDHLNPQERSFLEQYLNSLNEIDRSQNFTVSASMAGDTELTDSLIALYLLGKKTAASSLVEAYRAEGVALPQIGNLWIILDRKNIPRCIVKTLRIELYLFETVPEHVAIAEGEGDLSLTYWRQAHRNFFSRFLLDLKITDLMKGEVMVEFFEIVHR